MKVFPSQYDRELSMIDEIFVVHFEKFHSQTSMNFYLFFKIIIFIKDILITKMLRKTSKSIKSFVFCKGFSLSLSLIYIATSLNA